MQITNAADRVAATLEAKRSRRSWNPDLHPRDSKGRFIETGGIARMWGGGMARVIRALGGRNVLVENVTTHQRSTVNASRLTMVARPDGTAPTRSKRKVRDEDERRTADTRRGNGVDTDDPGDNGDTPDEPHRKDDEGEDIGADKEGEDHGAGPEPADDDPLVHRGRVMPNDKDDEGDPLPSNLDGNRRTRHHPNLLPIDGGERAGHVAGRGDALRARGPKATAKNPDREQQFQDTEHARRAVAELAHDYFADLEAVMPRDWDNAEARAAYDELYELSGDGLDLDELIDGDIPLETNKPRGQYDSEDLSTIRDLAEEAEHLAELAEADGRDEVARYAQNLADALNLTVERFEAHDGKKIPKAKKNGKPTPQAWADEPIPAPKGAPARPRPKKAAAPNRRKDPTRRFKSLDDVRAHWASGNLTPYTSDKDAQDKHTASTAELFDKLKNPQLSRNGHFVIGEMGVQRRNGEIHHGWGVILTDSGVRLAMPTRKGEAADFVKRLEAAQLNGEPFDWDAPDYQSRLNTPEGRAMVQGAASAAQKAFADKAAKKRAGAAARTTPAPANPEQHAAQEVAARTGVPDTNVGVGHVGPQPFGDERGRPRNSDELREFWKRGGSDDTPEAQRDVMRRLATDPNITLHLADHRGFAILEHTDRDDEYRFEVRAVGTARSLSGLGTRGLHTYGNFADRDTADRFTLYLGSRLRDHDGRTVDWGSPKLNQELNEFRDKDGNRSGRAIWEIAGEFDRERSVDSHAARTGRPRTPDNDERDPNPDAPNPNAPGEDVPTPQQAAGPQQEDQEEQQSERLQGAGEGVLGDVQAGGAGRTGGDDAAGDVLRTDQRGDRGADRGEARRVQGGDEAGSGLQGRAGGRQHGDDAGEGSGPARDAVRPAEGERDGGQGDAEGEPAEDRSSVTFGSPEQEQTAPQYQPPEDGRSLVPTGVLPRVKANIAAIETLRRLEAENRPATAAEQETLARWSGWGATPQVFVDDPKPEFAALQKKLRGLLSDKEWDAAKENTLNAHYTDPAIVQGVWNAVRELGFDGGNVLEPGSGSGNFIGYAPDNAEMTGVELDPITAGIAKALYPHATVRNEGFEETRAADGTFDMAIGNVPFGDYQVVDLRHNKGGHNIHNHFILKSLDLTRPGGLVAVVTSRYTMDGSTPRAEDARMEMARKADLVGAIRLPTGAHRRTAGTDVVTDLLIFRRREKDKDFTSGRTRTGAVKTPDQRKKDDPPMWVHSARVEDLPGQELDEDEKPDDAPKVYVNPYFLTNPSHVLGHMAVGHGMYGPGELRVDGDGDLNTAFDKALKKIVTRAKDAGLSYTPDTGERRKVEMLPEGSDRVDGHVQVAPDGTFTQVRDGMIHPFEVPSTQVEEARQLLDLRDSMKALVREESRPDTDEQHVEALRADLKARYDAYHAKFGSLNRFEWATRKSTDPETGQQVEKAFRKRPQMGGLITKDPTMAVVLSLDSYDDHSQTSTPAAIFTKRQSRHRTIADRADSPEDAMAIVMEQRGSLDTETLAKVMGTSPDKARERLLAARSTDPDTGTEYPLVFEPHNGGDLIPAADYLSGNVREKLEQAQALAAEDARFEINVKQLEDVLPPDLSPGEIDAPMGASWLGAGPVQAFLREKLNTRNVKVSYQGGSLWKVDAPDGVKKSRAATEVWGTGDYSAIKLAETILTNGRIRVTYKDDSGNTYVDEEATAAAQTKADELREEFQDWLWATPERSDQVKKRYNDIHNNLALRSYDGQRRTMPGLAEWFKPHAHQHAAVARMVNEPAVLLAHEVGAGKTAEMTMGVMELRRLGLINKAAMVVPNHMLQQFHDEFAELYPESASNGRILAASSEDLQGRKRREFIARVATGDYDAVILTQNAFESIPMRPEVQLEYVKREKEHLQTALRRQKEQDELDNPGVTRDSRMVKEIQNRLKKLEAKINAKIKASKDTAGLYFEDTGIDYVVVDEAHHYKNLSTNSGIPGAAIEGSNRASDLDMKLEYLRANTKSGRVVTFATATPISNSVTEAHTMLRYLRPDLLEKAKVRNFDEFASTYGKIVNGVELAADGSGFKEVARFAAFRNMPELLRIWRTVADVKNSDDLAEYLDTPDVASGKAITISVEPTDEMLAYQRELAARARDVKQGNVDPREDNMLKISSDGRKVSLDPRMVGLDEQGNKLPKAAENIARIYEETKDAVYPTSKNNPTPHDTPGGLQIVFLDMGTPQDPGKAKKKGKKDDSPTSVEELSQSRFPAYQELKDLLIERGVPAEKIRFIHEAKNDAEKARLFNDARTGKIAVLVGSTTKMGTGTNVQLRATALHHLDCPWRPADLEQRNGRIIRQGNANPEVAIFQYVTEQSFDGFSWQTVARKAKFIRQIMKGNLTDRTVEDIPDGVFNAEQVTAISTGNPYLLEQANVKASLAILKRKLKGHMRTIEGYKSTIRGAELLRESTDTLVAQLQDVIARRKSTRGDSFNATFGHNDYTKRDEAAKAFATAAHAVLRQGKADPYRSGGHPKIPIGKIGNIEVTAQYRTAWGDFGRVHLVDISFPDIPQSRHSYQEDDLKKESTLPITRLEDSLADVDKRIVRAESHLRQEERAAETARERVNRPFEQADELDSAERRSKLIGALIREQSKDTTSEEAGREKRARLDALEHQLREARLAAGEESGDVDDPAAAQDTDLLPRTPAAPSISTDDKGRPRILWPDAEARKAAKEREKKAKIQRAREERGETTLAPEQVRSDLDSLREDAPEESPEQRDESNAPEGTPAAPDASEAEAPQTDTAGQEDDTREETTTLDPAAVRADLDAISPEGQDSADAEPEDRTADVTSVPSTEPGELVGADQEDTDAAEREETAPTAGTATQADNDQEESESDAPAADLPTVGDQVNSPDGLGEVMAVHNGSVLVRAERGTRSHALKYVTRPDGTPFNGDLPDNTKEQQNAEKIAQAATHEGTELSTGHRLRDLDMDAGHGTIVDRDGNTIGWVRARIGDDGRRYWWGQDADGGAPAEMQWHEEMASQAGAAPIRAASIVRDGLDSIRLKYTGKNDENGKPEQEKRKPITPDRAITEMTLTPAQVRELSKLTLSGEYADGTPIDTLPWDPGHRRYSPYSAQAGAIAAAARQAAAQQDEGTLEGRRNKKVLLGAARKMERQQYDSARSAATLPPIGEPDAYDKPYEPRPEEPETDTPDVTPEQSAPEAGRDGAAPAGPDEPDETDAALDDDADDSEVLDPGTAQIGDYIRAETQTTAGNSVVREGYLLAAPKKVTATRDRKSVKAWRLHIGREGEKPSTRNAVTILTDEKIERLPAPEPITAPAPDDDVEHTNTLGWKGPEETRETVGEHDGKPVEVGGLHIDGRSVGRAVYLDGKRIGRLHGENGGWRAESDRHGSVGSGWFVRGLGDDDPTASAALTIARTHEDGEDGPRTRFEHGRAVSQDEAERRIAEHIDPRRPELGPPAAADTPSGGAATDEDASTERPPLSFPDGGSRAEEPRRWVGVWAEPQPAGLRNVFLDRVMAAQGDRGLPSDPWETRFWISSAFEAEPLAQFDENTRYHLGQMPESARPFLADQAGELRSLVQHLGEELRADIRPVLMDNIATRSGRKKANERLNQIVQDASKRAREAVREQIARAREGAAEHGLSAQQAEDFIADVAGGDNPDQMAYGVPGEFPEAIRPLAAAIADGRAYRGAFAGWATQDDTSNWAGWHHMNGRRSAMGLPMTPAADPRTGTGELKIGEAALPKGMRWARASELRQGDIFHPVHPRMGTTDAFDGMHSPQYVIHTHRDGLEGAIRSVTLDSHRGGRDPEPGDHVVIVENPEPAVRKRASHRARTDVYTKGQLPKDEEAYAAQSHLPKHPEGAAVAPQSLAEGDLVRVRGTERHGGIGQFEGYLYETPERTTFWRHGKESDGWKLRLGSNPEQLQNQHATGWNYYIAADDDDNWVERIDSMQTQHAYRALATRPDMDGHRAGQASDESEAREEDERQDEDAEDRDSRRRAPARGEGNEPDSGDGADVPGAGVPAPDTADDDRADDGNGDNDDQAASDAEQPDGEDQKENDRDGRRRRNRRRRRDRDGGGRNGGEPNGGLPRLPNLPDNGNDRSGGDDDARGAVGAGRTRRLADLKDRYRSGQASTPRGANPEEHAAYLRNLADNDTLALSPDGGLITWSDDDGRTWQFGHAVSGMHLAGWDANGEEIGGAAGARRLAGEYEQLRDPNGDRIDWASPDLDEAALRAWHNAEGMPLGSAVAQARQFAAELHRGNADRSETPDADMPGQMGGSPDGADQRDDRGQNLANAVATATEGSDGQDTATAGAEPASAATSQYAVNAEHPQGERRAGTVNGRRVPTAEEMKQYESGGKDRVISEEGERALFGSPEGMRELAAQGFVPAPVIRSDRDGEIWRNGRLIGTLREPNRSGYHLSEPDPVWWSEPSFGPSLHFSSREAAIAHVVLRDMERGEPDLNIVHPDIAWDMRHTNRSLGFPDENLRGLESLNDSPADMDRYRELRRIVDRLGRGETVTGNVADDLDHLHDELRWLDAVHYQHQPANLKDKYILGPGWLADKIREYLDVLRPEDPRAMHHDTRNDRAAKQVLDALRADGGRDRAEIAPVGNIRQGDVVYLDGRVTGRYAGATSRMTGYVIGEPRKATLTTNGKRQKAWRITVGLSPRDGKNADSETFIIPVGENVARLASVDDIDLPLDEHTYGRRVGEAPQVDVTPDQAAMPDAPEARTTPDGTEELRPNTAPRANAPSAAAQSGNEPAAGPSGGIDTERAATDTPEQGSTAPAPATPHAETPGSRKKKEEEIPAPDTDSAEEPPAPEPVGGRPAEWVKVGDLGLRDLVRIEGITKGGTPRTLAGYVVDGPKKVPTTKARRVQDMYRVLISDTPDGRGKRNSIWVMPDATAARATRDDADQIDGAPQTGADSDVLTGRIADHVPTDRNGNGLFPGSVVTDDNGREGVVTGASASTTRVQFGDDRTDDTQAPTSLNVTDGGAGRPTGWTTDGHLVRPGNVVADHDGNMLGTVEDVDGDTANVATPQGMTDLPITDLRVVGGVADDSDAGGKVDRVEPTTAGELDEGDVLVRDTPDGPRTARVTRAEKDGETSLLDVEDTTTGEADQLSVPSDSEALRALGADGRAPELGPDDAADNDGEITTHEPAPAVDPVTGPTVDPQLSPEERDAIADRGDAPTGDPAAQQAAARLANDLPVTPDQASALADDLRDGADSSTPEGRAAQRAANHLAAAAGEEPDDTARPEPGTIGAVGVGDTIALPGEFDPDTLASFKIVKIEDAPGGARVLTIEDADGMRFKRSLGSGQPLYQLPEPQTPAGDDDADAKPRDPNPAPDADQLRSDYADSVVRAVVDNAIQGTATPGSIHQLREQIAAQLTPEALRPAMRRARNGALSAITDAGIDGDERAELVRSLREEAARARTDAIRAAVRTLDDLEPLDGESEEDTARRAADLLRLIPDALRNRPEPDIADGDSRVDDAVSGHVDDAVGNALQGAAAGGLTEERRAAIVRRLAARMAANRDATAQRIAATLPAGQRAGLLTHIVAALVVLARKIVAVIAAFLKGLAQAWRKSREGLRRMRERIARFRRNLVQRVKSWPEARRLRRLAAATNLPGHADGLSLGDRIAHWARLLPAPGRFGQVSGRSRWYRPTSRTSLAAGQLPPVQDGVRWVPDRAVDGGPGPQALRHLAAVRAAGLDMDSDIAARLTAAAPELGNDPHGTVRHAADHADTAERRLRDLQAAEAGGAPDADMEIDAARAEAQAARQEAQRLQRAYAAALPDIVRDTLAEIRDMGPAAGSHLITTPDSDPEATRALVDVSRFVPRDWLTPTEARFLAARNGDAGNYDGQTATVADLGDAGRLTAANALLAHLQQHYPDLMAAQEAFHFSRTHRGRTGARRRTSLDVLLGRLFRNRATQGTPDDIVPLGLATLFDGRWYEDDDLRAFLLGLLATR
ncbi:helicase-related protein [Streptomyces sp. NPDC053427]|uniref:helicase-related protein n=1 Tax=Streptomyces sp. NPDC053427 TaxID=3365701 RepID=UPI0037CE7E1C